jgi:ssDNA-binding Zn-finger/Zn-ribbon topoisomerase 1
MTTPTVSVSEARSTLSLKLQSALGDTWEYYRELIDAIDSLILARLAEKPEPLPPVADAGEVADLKRQLAEARNRIAELEADAASTDWKAMVDERDGLRQQLADATAAKEKAERDAAQSERNWKHHAEVWERHYRETAPLRAQLATATQKHAALEDVVREQVVYTTREAQHCRDTGIVSTAVVLDSIASRLTAAVQQKAEATLACCKCGQQTPMSKLGTVSINPLSDHLCPACLSAALASEQPAKDPDAPACDNCGHITIRDGNKWACANCGNSLGIASEQPASIGPEDAKADGWNIMCTKCGHHATVPNDGKLTCPKCGHSRRTLEAIFGPAPAKPDALPADVRRVVASIPCAGCAGPVVEFTVPNDVWNTVVRRNGPERSDEYLCEACYRKAVEGYVRDVRRVVEAAVGYVGATNTYGATLGDKRRLHAAVDAYKGNAADAGRE